jgi:NAD-dependent SIR2 family protein deacetylase
MRVDRHCSEAKLSLCLGTSLLITPSCNLPIRTVRAGGSLAIVVSAGDAFAVAFDPLGGLAAWLTCL